MALLGCGSGGSGGGIFGLTSGLGARLEGVVTALEDGRPIALVTIRVTTFVRTSQCADEPIGLPAETVSAEEGEYALTLSFEGVEEFDACLTIEAVPPPGFDFEPLISRVQVEMRPVQEGIVTVVADLALSRE